MADREMIAAMLTVPLLEKFGVPGQTRSATGEITADRVAVGRHAVGLYETILGMLQARPDDLS